MIHKSDKDAQQGVVTDIFILWCQKLEDLDEDGFKRGMYAMESRQSLMYAEGREMWPPSYAEFIGLCKEPEPEKTENWAAYKHFDSSKAIEDKTAKEERYKKGVQHCNDILKLLSE